MATNKKLKLCHDNQQKPQILSKFGFHVVQNIRI